ncbi:hypothetical protein T492DRAFT_988888, partial [Pavlovales sp. CCMP2436]
LENAFQYMHDKLVWERIERYVSILTGLSKADKARLIAEMKGEAARMLAACGVENAMFKGADGTLDKPCFQGSKSRRSSARAPSTTTSPTSCSRLPRRSLRRRPAADRSARQRSARIDPSLAPSGGRWQPRRQPLRQPRQRARLGGGGQPESGECRRGCCAVGARHRRGHRRDTANLARAPRLRFALAVLRAHHVDRLQRRTRRGAQGARRRRRAARGRLPRGAPARRARGRADVLKLRRHRRAHRLEEHPRPRASAGLRARGRHGEEEPGGQEDLQARGLPHSPLHLLRAQGQARRVQPHLGTAVGRGARSSRGVRLPRGGLRRALRAVLTR